MSIPPSTLRRILREVRELTTAPPEGVRLCGEEGQDEDEVEEDMSKIMAWVEGPPGTPFEGGYFKIRFAFGAEYPASPPKCTFVTKIFHPNVNPTNGEICVNTLKKDWKSEYGISHILLVVKCLLIHPNPDSALHAEAGRLLHDAFEDYANRARLMTSIHATPRVRPSEFGPPSPSPPPSTSSTLSPPSPKPSSSTSIPALSPNPNPLQPSTFSNTDSASPVPEKPLSPGKRARNVSNVGMGGSSGEMGGPAVEVKSEKVVVKKVAVGAKKRGLKRL